MISQSPDINSLAMRLISILFFAFLAACSTSGSDNAGTRPNNFLAIGSNSWLGVDTRYSALANGPIASDIGQALSAPAKKRAIEAEYTALEKSKSGEIVTWQYSNSQSGKITPYSLYQVGSSSCRRYIHSVSVNGSTKQAAGTACRDEDGTWTPLT